MSYTAMREIEKEIKRGEFSELSMEQMIDRVCSRKIGCGIEQVNISQDRGRYKTLLVEGRLIRASTPLEHVKATDIPSPSESKQDCISLPSESAKRKERMSMMDLPDKAKLIEQ